MRGTYNRLTTTPGGPGGYVLLPSRLPTASLTQLTKAHKSSFVLDGGSQGPIEATVNTARRVAL